MKNINFPKILDCRGDLSFFKMGVTSLLMSAGHIGFMTSLEGMEFREDHIHDFDEVKTITRI